MFNKCLANELIPTTSRQYDQSGLILTPDWKKTAGILTQGTDTTVDQYLDNIAKENTPIGRFASRKNWPISTSSCVRRVRRIAWSSTYYVDGGWLKTIE